MPHIANYGFDIFQMLRFLGTIQQHIMPVGGIEILDGVQFQTVGIDVLSQCRQFFIAPKLRGVPRAAPPGLGSHRLVLPIAAPLVEVIHQMNDYMRATTLPRKTKILRREHVTVQPQTEFHGRSF